MVPEADERLVGTNNSALKIKYGFLERAKGFEPSTPTLARLCSTPELRPRSDNSVLGRQRLPRKWRS